MGKVELSCTLALFLLSSMTGAEAASAAAWLVGSGGWRPAGDRQARIWSLRMYEFEESAAAAPISQAPSGRLSWQARSGRASGRMPQYCITSTAVLSERGGTVSR